MKILLIGNYLPDAQQSMQRFSAVLESGLIEAGFQVRLLYPQVKWGQFNPGDSGLGKWLGYIDKFIQFPSLLTRHLSWADVVHICDHSNGFYTQYLQQIPHVVTCNDLLAVRSALGEIPENPTRWTGRQLQKIILNGLNRAQQIACISEKTRDDLLRITRLSKDKTATIYMGLNYPYTPMPEVKYRQYLSELSVPTDTSFILHVGGNQWYKNREGAIEIFSRVKQKFGDRELYLVMAGAPLTDRLQQIIKAHQLDSHIISCINIDNESLRALYSAATALLFPSLQEGFGWPIIEAHACGCPVFTSGIPPMTEVGGEVALYIDPYDIGGSATKILDFLERKKYDPNPLLANARRFDTQKMIREYITLYRRVIEEKQNA